MTSLKKLLPFLKNIYGQALLVGLLAILPFAVYVTITDRIIAPLNITAGWDTSQDKDSVIAPVPSDITQQMLPFREYTKDSITSHHEIPLWNNKSFAGDVFLANPINTALSPFNLLLFFVDIYTFQNCIVLFGLFFLSACTYLLLRQLRLSTYASTIGSLAFSLAPFSIFWSIYGIVTIPMATIPLVLFFYLKWKESKKLLSPYLLFITLALAFAAYTGHIQIALLPYIVLFLHVLYDLLFVKLGIKRAGFVALAAICAIGLSAAQLLPMAAQIPQSHRSQEVEIVDPKPWSSRIEELSNIPSSYQLASGPDNLGANDRRELLIGQMPGLAFFVGIGTALAMLIRKRAPHWVFFYAILFIFGAFWQWNDFPQTLLNTISPTFRSLATDYFLPIALLGMAVVAAYGVDWLLRNLFKITSSKKVRPYEQFILFTPLAAIFLLSLPQLMLSRVNTLTTSYYVLYYSVIILSIVFYITRKNKRYAALFFGILLAMTTLLQGWALWRVSQPIVQREITVTKNPQLNLIIGQDDDSSTKPAVIDTSNQFEDIFYNVSLISGYDSLYSSSILNRIQAINHPNKTLQTYRNNALIINNVDKSMLFKNLGVEYILNQKPIEGYIEKQPGIYIANQPTPKVYFASTILNQPKKGQLDTLRSGNVAYHEVPIEGNFQVADPTSKATYRQTPNSLKIETDSQTGGLLFIAQTYNKDWIATLDEKERTSIHPAYYDFSAINVPAGKHSIDLAYVPNSYTAGSAISIATALLLVLSLAAPRIGSLLHRIRS